MKKLNKTIAQKLFPSIRSLALASLILIGAGCNVDAKTPAMYNFETWNGNGNPTVEVNYDQSQLLELNYNGTTVDAANYNVEVTNGNTVISMNESYLKSLNLVNGDYSFWGIFADNGEMTDSHGYIMQENDTYISVSRGGNNQLIKVAQLAGETEEIVDPSNYTVTTTEEAFIITFNEAYLSSLSGETAFYLYFSGESQVILNLPVDYQAVSIPTDTIENVDNIATMEVTNQETVVNAPKTADVTTILPCVFVCMGAVVVMVSIKRREKV